MTRIGWHLTWEPIPTTIREARQDMSDAEWTGGNVRAARSRLDALIRERQAGVLFTPPF